MKAININVQGSAPYYYLYFLHKFKTVGVDGLLEEDKANLNKFITQPSFKDTWQSKQITLRHKLLKFDSQKTTEEERKVIIEELLKNELKSFNFSHTKPDKGEGGT